MKAVGILLIVALMFTSQTVSFAGALDPKDLTKLKLLTFSPPDKAPEFTLKNLEGREVSLAMYQGKPLMLYFWATW
jgi:cytochrome oxidase Cu insertion factor (SCO1/SenC/PrrC family)